MKVKNLKSSLNEFLAKKKIWKKFFTNEDEYADFLLKDIKLEWKIRRENQEDALWRLINDNKIAMEEAKQELIHLEKNSNKEIRKTFLKGFVSEEEKSWWIRME